MAVAHSADATGGTGSTNGVIGFLNISTTPQTNISITIGASDTTCIIFIEYEKGAITTGWTVTLGSQTASLISGSSFNQNNVDDVSVIAFEVKNPTVGSHAVNISNSTFSPTIPGYMSAMSFTGSDTVNPSVAFGTGTNTAGDPATTGNSGSSIPSTDMITAWFSNTTQSFNGTVGASTATSVIDVDLNQSNVNNVEQSRATGGNAVTTMTATQGASVSYVAVAVWVKVPVSAPVVSVPLGILGFVENEF